MAIEKESGHVDKLYRHFKGGRYKVMCLGTHTETNEELVVYYDANAEWPRMWVRPVSMWADDCVDPKTGDIVPRFRKVHDGDK